MKILVTVMVGPDEHDAVQHFRECDVHGPAFATSVTEFMLRTLENACEPGKDGVSTSEMDIGTSPPTGVDGEEFDTLQSVLGQIIEAFGGDIHFDGLTPGDGPVTRNGPFKPPMNDPNLN